MHEPPVGRYQYKEYCPNAERSPFAISCQRCFFSEGHNKIDISIASQVNISVLVGAMFAAPH
jgi:hypothetical protein